VCHKITTVGRRCPTCGRVVDWWLNWIGSRERQPSDTVVCRNPDCWSGPWSAATPSSRKRKCDDQKESTPSLMTVPHDPDPSAYREHLDMFSRVFQLERATTQSLSDFETQLQNHSRGDPDDRGHRAILLYNRNLSRLAVLKGMIQIYGLSGYEDAILRHEIDFLFPKWGTTK